MTVGWILSTFVFRSAGGGAAGALLGPRRGGRPAPAGIGCVLRSGTEPDRVLNDHDIPLYVLCALGGILDVVEDFAQRGLLEHLAGERDGPRDEYLYNAPWYLILPSSIDGLQLAAYIPKVCGVLVNTFGAVVYPGPFWRHSRQSTRLNASIVVIRQKDPSRLWKSTKSTRFQKLVLSCVWCSFRKSYI